MNAESRKKVEEKIQELNKIVAAKMINEEKSKYDPEIKLPQYDIKSIISTKRAYSVMKDTKDNAKNKKRRENRPSVLEQYILDEKYEEAKKVIHNTHYSAITKIAQREECCCNEKTAITIMKAMFKMIGYNIKSAIPNVLVDELISCITKWTLHNKTMYKYNNGKIRPLDMNQDEMLCVYDTYILIKKIILINSNSKEEYDKYISKLNKELTPVYAAIRALKEIQ